MKKNDRFITALRSIDADLREQNLESAADTDETLTGRLSSVVRVFSAVRPLLVGLMLFPGLPSTSRKAVKMFVQSLDALAVLAVPGGTDDVADFKAGRDL